MRIEMHRFRSQRSGEIGCHWSRHGGSELYGRDAALSRKLSGVVAAIQPCSSSVLAASAADHPSSGEMSVGVPHRDFCMKTPIQIRLSLVPLIFRERENVKLDFQPRSRPGCAATPKAFGILLNKDGHCQG